MSIFSNFAEEVCKKNAKECPSISWWFVPHILRDSPPQAPRVVEHQHQHNRPFLSPLFCEETTFSHRHCAPHQKTWDASTFCCTWSICCLEFCWFRFCLVKYEDMLTGDFFRSWGLFHLQGDGDVAKVSNSVQNNPVNYIELQRNEEIPWARLTLKILFFMQILFFLEPGYTCFVCFSERWKSTLFNLKCI